MTCATFRTLGLARKTYAVAANGATLNMLGASSFATGPTGDATAFAVGLVTVGTGDNAALGADNFLAGFTL